MYRKQVNERTRQVQGHTPAAAALTVDGTPLIVVGRLRLVVTWEAYCSECEGLAPNQVVAWMVVEGISASLSSRLRAEYLGAYLLSYSYRDLMVAA